MALDRDEQQPAGARSRLARPIVEFLHTEAAGGVVLVIAALVALVWANSPWQQSYFDLWHTHLSISLGSHTLDLTLEEWVNDGLMTIFFFVVGLEIKRELVEGELRDPRRAALPAIAAVGGMLVPALLYLAINAGGEGARGWGIPMATDIAIAVGVVSLLGSRVPSSLKVFLLALAIVDDVGAIIVIAVFYSKGISFTSLGVAVLLAVLVLLLRWFDVRLIPLYVLVGASLWLALEEGGVHATLAGVFLGLVTPSRPVRRPDEVDGDALLDLSTPQRARESAVMARESVSVVGWLEHALHPWSSLVIVPLFALANAGIPLDADALSTAARSRIAWGVAVGLVVGKLVGVSSFAWLAARLGWGAFPEGTTTFGVLGVAGVAGIGFTVSIFVAGLAFDDVALQDQAKVGILIASVVAAALGSILFARHTVTRRSEVIEEPA
jgi:NhaA family Na+:H+ antiporter